MDCCRVTDERRKGTGRFLGGSRKSYARSFRRGGLEKIQQLMLEGVRTTLQGNLTERKILDIGCGVGALHMTLLSEGAASAQGVDLSPDMLDQAAQLAAARNLGEKVEYSCGDFVELADSIQPADVTLLDKVVCCYEDPASLLGRSADLTGAAIAFSFPRDRWFIAAVWRTQAFFAKLFRFRFYPCWHDWPTVPEVVLQRGFAESFRARTFLWEVAVFSERREPLDS